MAVAKYHDPNDSYFANRLLQQLQQVLALSGYQILDTPILESAEIFLTRAGDQIINKLFTFERHGSQLALRPEFTAVAAHHYASREHGITRWQFAGPVFQDDSHQNIQRLSVGAELIGIAGPAADAEIMALAAQGIILHQISDWKLLIGNTGLTRALLSDFRIDNLTIRFLLSRINELLAHGVDHVLDQFQQNLHGTSDFSLSHPVEMIEAADLSLTETNTHEMLKVLLDATERGSTMGGRTRQDIAQRLLRKRQRLIERDQLVVALQFLAAWTGIQEPAETALPRMREIAQHNSTAVRLLEEWQTTLDILNVYGIPLENIIIQPHIARNWDYYTGVVFEIQTASGTHLCGGGRYDELIALFGSTANYVPAVGFAYYVDQILDSIPVKAAPSISPVAIPVHSDNYLSSANLAQLLRRHGIPSVLLPPEHVSTYPLILNVSANGDVLSDKEVFSIEQLDLLIDKLRRIYNE